VNQAQYLYAEMCRRINENPTSWKMERSISVKMFRVRLQLRPQFCRRQSTDYQQVGDRETLTISIWSTNGGAQALAGPEEIMDF
jgi:hypothetical protein